MGIDYASAAKGDDLSITWAGQLPALIAGRVVEHLQRPVASESEFKVTVKVEERCGHLARSTTCFICSSALMSCPTPNGWPSSRKPTRIFCSDTTRPWRGHAKRQCVAQVKQPLLGFLIERHGREGSTLEMGQRCVHGWGCILAWQAARRSTDPSREKGAFTFGTPSSVDYRSGRGSASR